MTEQDETTAKVPGLSKAAQGTLRAVRDARLTAGVWREGEPYADRQQRQEETVAGAWQKGRADPRVADELDRFMATAGRRLGEEGARNALRAANSGKRMELPGVGREHQAELEGLARSYAAARDNAQCLVGAAD